MVAATTISIVNINEESVCMSRVLLLVTMMMMMDSIYLIEPKVAKIYKPPHQVTTQGLATLEHSVVEGGVEWSGGR